MTEESRKISHDPRYIVLDNSFQSLCHPGPDSNNDFYIIFSEIKVFVFVLFHRDRSVNFCCIFLQEFFAD